MAPDGTRPAPPRAGPMIEALRGLGYSAATALADVIDNSISAGASTVDVSFHWERDRSFVTVLDDGCGMDDHGLEVAMRLGELNPLALRDAGDLGRFGLGLKTASFSQARRLTVASRRDGVTSCLRWDLDFLAASADQEWLLLEGPAEGSEERLQPLSTSTTGTLVLWENLDRLVTAGTSEQDFLDLVDQVEAHLGMVFHRFIQPPSRRLRLTINERPVKPWDPFMVSHPATWSSPIIAIGGGEHRITASGHVLPHKDRLSDGEYQAGAGPDGWTSQQGFYVYRNERLLLAGGWLGLGRGRVWTREEQFRLARLRLDLPNTADAEWKIDVRKSRARPPVVVREQLTRLAEDIRDRARSVFAHRGQVLTVAGREPLVQAWRAEHFRSGMRYRIDLDHPAVRLVLDEAGDLGSKVRAMLRIIEETIPVQRIWLDTAEGKETPRIGFAGEPDTEVKAVLEIVYRNLVRKKGLSPADARAHLLRVEPFNQHPGLVAQLDAEPAVPGGQ